MVSDSDMDENRHYLSEEVSFTILRDGTIELHTGAEEYVYLTVDQLEEMINIADLEARVDD